MCDKFGFIVNFGGSKITQVLDKLIVNLFREHQLHNRFNSPMIIFFWVLGLFSVASIQVRDETGQDFLDPTPPANFKICAG